MPAALRQDEREPIKQVTGPLVKVGLPPDDPKPRRSDARTRPKTTGLFTRLVKQRSRWWYFIFAFAATYYYIPDVAAQSQTGVKLNRVFFPRLALQVRSLDCRFAR